MKGVPEVMVRALMSLYEGKRTRVRVGSALSEEFKIAVEVRQGSVLSTLLLAVVVNLVTESARDGLLLEIVHADDLVSMSETLEGLMEKFWKWKEAFERKGLKVNLGKTEIIMSGTECQRAERKVDQCGVCGKRTMANSRRCTECQKWVHGSQIDKWFYLWKVRKEY